MKTLFLFLLFLASCATKNPDCPATKSVNLTKKQQEKMNGAGPFLTDAQITQEHDEEGVNSVWRLNNMPSDSIYYFLGLQEEDAIYKTNLGVQSNSLYLIGDLQGIPKGTTNCLWIKSKDNVKNVIKIELEK